MVVVACRQSELQYVNFIPRGQGKNNNNLMVRPSNTTMLVIRRQTFKVEHAKINTLKPCTKYKYMLILRKSITLTSCSFCWFLVIYTKNIYMTCYNFAFKFHIRQNFVRYKALLIAKNKYLNISA